MATKVVVCPECESPLPSGRYSCSSCGALLAAVATEVRSFAPAPPETPPLAPIAVDHDSAAAVGDVEALDDELPQPTSRDEPANAAASSDWPHWGDRDAEAHARPAAAAATLPDGPRPAPPATSWPEAPAWPARPAAADIVVATAAPQAIVAAPVIAPSWPEQPAWPPAVEVPMAPEPLVRTPAGAYLPPSAVLPPGDALPVNGRNPHGNAPAPAADAKPRRSLAELFALGEADGPLGLPVDVPGRTIALGTALAGLGLLLPWAAIVIGSSSMGSFLDQWGLAAPGHPIVLLLLAAVGVLAVAHERWPVRVNMGTAAIVLGSILLGLVFPYVMGPFQEAVGVYVAAAGAIIMIAGGLLARSAPRHVGGDATV